MTGPEGDSKKCQCFNWYYIVVSQYYSIDFCQKRFFETVVVIIIIITTTIIMLNQLSCLSRTSTYSMYIW
jgi:hypothetical protein